MSVDAIADAMGDELLVAHGTSFFRDARIAAWFARHRNATRVRLLSEERPDFEIEIAGEVISYEATEADRKGRRRGVRRGQVRLCHPMVSSHPHRGAELRPERPLVPVSQGWRQSGLVLGMLGCF